MGESFTVSRAAAHELLPACRLLFSDRVEGESRERLLASSELSGLFVARAGGRLCAAALVQELPGALAVFWPPRGNSPEAEDAATAAACDWLRERGVKVGHAFAAVKDAADMAPLERCGFRHTTQVVFLSRELALEDTARSDHHEEFVLNEIPSPYPKEFEAALVATHQHTLDCPELNASRTDSEVLAGFLVTPGSRFYRIDHARIRIGLFMLETDQSSEKIELTYLGVLPEYRRRGFGAHLVRLAIGTAARSGARVLTVGVDARNTPAMKLYTRHGFAEYDRRAVWLAHLIP